MTVAPRKITSRRSATRGWRPGIVQRIQWFREKTRLTTASRRTLLSTSGITGITVTTPMGTTGRTAMAVAVESVFGRRLREVPPAVVGRERGATARHSAADGDSERHCRRRLPSGCPQHDWDCEPGYGCHSGVDCPNLATQQHLDHALAHEKSCGRANEDRHYGPECPIEPPL